MLREYQERAITLTGERLRAGDKRVIIFMATGAGKSVIFNEMIRKLIFNGKKVLFLVRRRELIFQAAKKHFKKMKLETSIIMGNEKGFKRNCLLQVCSIDTLSKRIKKEKYHFLKDFDYIFCDEAHDCTSPTYQKVLSEIDTRTIGLTATPFQVGRKAHDWWDSCVKPIEIDELVELGFLTTTKIFAPPSIDTSNIDKIGNDFNQSQLFEAASKFSVVGDIVENYKKLGEGKAAILFAVNIKHSVMMCQAFINAGIPAAHCDQSSSKEEREIAINDLETGKIKVLCNVNIFSTGVDIKGVEVGIMARPTMSEILYIQQIGRVLRTYKICGNCGGDYVGEPNCPHCQSTKLSYEKKYAIILDHGENVLRHGMPNKNRDAALVQIKKKEMGKTEVKIRMCPKCFSVMDRKEMVCLNCNHEFEIKPKDFKREDGELVLIDENEYKKQMKSKINDRWSTHQKAMRYKTYVNLDYAYEKIFDEFGSEAFKFINFPPAIKQSLLTKTIMKNSNKVFN